MSKDKSTGVLIAEAIASMSMALQSLKEDLDNGRVEPLVFVQLINISRDLRALYIVHASLVMGMPGVMIGTSLGITPARVSQIKSEWLKKKQQPAIPSIQP